VKNVNHKANMLTKQTLFGSEINKLYETPCGNANVKRAFLFATQTGLRFCDIIRLQWKHITLNPGYIDFRQKKTDQKGFVHLSASAIRLLGEPATPMDHVFQMPSSTATNKDLKHWVKNAGIKKHITFHCARHSFGTNVQQATGDLMVTSKLMGHASTRHTEKYTHVSDERRISAINKLPGIEF
jgi:integrase